MCFSHFPILSLLTFLSLLFHHLQTSTHNTDIRLETNKGRIAVKGTAGSNSTHSINEDERRSFTDHINGVSVSSSSTLKEEVLMIRSCLLIKILGMSYRSTLRLCSCLMSVEVCSFPFKLLPSLAPCPLTLPARFTLFPVPRARF